MHSSGTGDYSLLLPNYSPIHFDNFYSHLGSTGYMDPGLDWIKGFYIWISGLQARIYGSWTSLDTEVQYLDIWVI